MKSTSTHAVPLHSMSSGFAVSYFSLTTSNCEPAAFSLIMKTLGLEILDCSVVKEVESSCTHRYEEDVVELSSKDIRPKRTNGGGRENRRVTNLAHIFVVDMESWCSCHTVV